MTNQNIELQVLVNNKPVKTWGHQSRTYVEAKAGSEYSLKIKILISKQRILILHMMKIMKLINNILLTVF